ncbi:hypothetical protein AB0J83_01725 [Actinoplanes sp. NPDC049596]|uniref:hypothetical protein n=1 Tax=unclassified Actinoplanes TaxID=2626549 RepID=UPI0034486D5A
MFGRFRKGFKPDLDHSQADLQLRAARDRAMAGDWAAAAHLLQDTGPDWELRSRRLAVLGIAAGHAPQWVDAWEAAAPGDPSVAILRANGLRELAQQARGAASARNTSAEQFREFHRLSALAAEAGERAVAMNPADPYPWVTRMDAMVANGHQHLEDFQVALKEATDRDPYHFDAHLRAVSFLCEKWYGSHEQMFAAARGPAAAAPAGASVVMLPLLAHFEYALREYGFETRAESLAAKSEYFRRPEVMQEIAWCAAKWQAAGEPRLIACGVTLRHWLALANYLADHDRPGTQRLLAPVGSYLGSVPAYGYFWMKSSEGFEAVSKWARS